VWFCALEGAALVDKSVDKVVYVCVHTRLFCF
jgi:hypothetical protein